MRNNQKGSGWGAVFALLIFALFAGSLLLVLLTGAGSYQRLSARDAASYERSTTLQYIAAKLRAADGAGGVEIGRFGGEAAPGEDGAVISTLSLEQEIEGERYVTRIYYYEGFVYELLAVAGAQLRPEDGNPILESGGLRFSREGSLIRVESTAPSGEKSALELCLRSAREVAG